MYSLLMKKIVLAGLTTGLFMFGMVGMAQADSFTSLSDFQNVTTTSLINFDSVNHGSQIGNTYSGLGVTFTDGNYVGTPGQAVSSPRAWYNDTLDNNAHLFDADFGTGIRAVGVQHVKWSGFGGAELRAYGIGDGLLGSVNSDNDSSTMDFFGLTVGQDIARIEVSILGNGWGLDDLRIGQAAPVPEPATMLLFGLGLLGLAGVNRRKK